MKKINYFVITLFATLLISSCASREDVVYFSKMNKQKVSNKIEGYAPTLINDDKLEIYVVALDMQSVGPFNGVGISGEGASKAEKPIYLIDQLGNVKIPIIGNIHLAGLTRLEAVDLLEEKIRVYVKNPIVSIRIANFKVTVLGEVNKPGTFKIEEERVTILEALGLAGDMTIYGERKNVLVIRESDGKKTYTRVDLTSDEIFDSPIYYLSQNDVVYIEPNASRLNQSKANLRGIVLPVTAILISAATVVAIYSTR